MLWGDPRKNMKKLVIRAALAAGSLGAPVSVAVADEVPSYDVRKSCKVDLQSYSTAQTNSGCLADEQSARAALVSQWTQFTPEKEVAVLSGRLPRWLRIVLVLSLGILAAGAGLFGYRYITQPTTLTIAAGSLDGDVPRIMSAMAQRMASTNAPIRLKVVEKATSSEAAKEFAAGNVDLVIARADLVDLSIARAVLAVTHGVVLIVVPPGSPIEGMDDLRGKMIGVISADTNRQVIAAITKEYGLESAKVSFKNLAPPEVPQAFQTKQIQALLVVLPLSEKYIAMLRDIFPRN